MILNGKAAVQIPMRLVIICLLTLQLACLCFAQEGTSGAASKDQTPTFRKNVNLVNVFFTVKDKHGALLANLPSDQFEVLEEGKPQSIKYFTAENDLPLTLGIMVDSSQSMERMLPEEKVVATDFLR